MRRSIEIVVLFMLISGCATRNIDEQYRPTSTNGNGIVIGSITYQGNYAEYQVVYRRRPDGPPAFVHHGESAKLIPYIPKGDFENNEPKGSLYAIELPEGDYEIYNWHVFCGAYRIAPLQEFSLPFHVQAGKVTYVGNTHFLETSKRFLAVTGVSVTQSDESARDLAVFMRKYPNFSKAQIAETIAPGTHIDRLGSATSTSVTPIPTSVYR